jgi:acetyltransferase
MTVRNLAATLNPASIVLIGVSSREGSVGNVVLRNVITGRFAGRIYPVNPPREELTLLMGRVLREKIAMLSLCTSLGSEFAPADEPQVVQVSLRLNSHEPAA